MKNPLVSIITVDYNNFEVTRELLISLEKCTYPNLEILVVDNGSKNPIKAEDISDYKGVKLISSTQNLGFAGGNNLAIAQASGDFIMLLNNDTEVDPGFLEPLVEQMLLDPKIGICGSKLLYHDSPNTIQYAGSTALSKISMQSHCIGFGEKDNGQYQHTSETNLAHGAAMLVRKSAIEQAGMMPEEYFLYYEEIDWCMKIKSCGYRIVFVPQSVVFHKESRSVGKQSPLQVYYKTRNRILLSRKWNSGLSKVLSMCYLGSVALRDFIKFSFLKMPEHRKVVKNAIIWHLKHQSI